MVLTDTFGGSLSCSSRKSADNYCCSLIMTCIMKPVKGISRWFLLKLKLFKHKMKQLSFFLSDSYGKHMIVSHLDSSKIERCAVKFYKNALSKMQRKEPDI